MKAADLSDVAVLAVVRDFPDVGVPHNPWTFTDTICRHFADVPPKVVMAKLRRLKKRGLIDGCDCGCRGDWHLTPRAAEANRGGRS